MPELPEVEVTRRSFAHQIEGAKIQSVWMGKPLRWPLGCEPNALAGQFVKSVRRRGKYLLIDLSRGLLIIHLGMSGSLRFARSLPLLDKHDHFEMMTNQGTLRLHDPRRFGAVVYSEDEGGPTVQKMLGKLGMEPLDVSFSLITFKDGLKKSRSSIKQVLLAGHLVVGVGNIYASEVLFMAGILPTARACDVGPRRAVRLHAAIRAVLMQAVNMGGSTLRDFANADGDSGHFQTAANVYGRSGEPCPVCQIPISVIRQGQRSSYFCRRCQRA